MHSLIYSYLSYYIYMLVCFVYVHRFIASLTKHQRQKLFYYDVHCAAVGGNVIAKSRRAAKSKQTYAALSVRISTIISFVYIAFASVAGLHTHYLMVDI